MLSIFVFLENAHANSQGAVPNRDKLQRYTPELEKRIKRSIEGNISFNEVDKIVNALLDSMQRNEKISTNSKEKGKTLTDEQLMSLPPNEYWQ